MHILYIDGSGSVANPGERHFVLAGVAVFERSIYHLIQKLDDLVDSFGLDDPQQTELHGSPMYSGKGNPWRTVPRNDREAMMNRTLGVLHDAHRNARAFGVAVEKAAVGARDPVEVAFEEICNRFNLYLQRRYHRGGRRAEDRQRGLVVMDKSHYEETLQTLARSFRVGGTQWGQLRNLAEVPLFVDSRASRLIQLADLVAYAVWRRYEFQDGRFLEPIINRFDNEGGVLHGLVHHRRRDGDCYCPACMSRQRGSPAAASPAP